MPNSSEMRRERSMESCEDQDALMFHTYPPCAYYVQSPSTISHANSADILRNNTLESVFHSPTRSETTFHHKNNNLNNNNHSNLDVSRFTLSHYSSSRGSNNSFVHDQKIKVLTDLDHEPGADIAGKINKNRLIIIDDHDEEEDEEDDGSGKKGLWWRYFSFRRSNSCAWISLQISWRLFLSLGVALLVFYMATKPSPPLISIKMAGIREFGLGEGVDSTGVTTKILTCNCSIQLLIDNKSKLFVLHVNPPLMKMSFAHLPFAFSHGPKLYAGSHGSTLFELYVGTKNKAMYGAGRNMQDMLESGMGLPLMIHMSFSSNYRIVWDLIKPKFNYEAQCLLVLHTKYDNKHATQPYNSTCTIF